MRIRGYTMLMKTYCKLNLNFNELTPYTILPPLKSPFKQTPTTKIAIASLHLFLDSREIPNPKLNILYSNEKLCEVFAKMVILLCKIGYSPHL